MYFNRILIVLLIVLAGCELPPRNQNTVAKSMVATRDNVNIQNEEYVMVTTAVTMPMYVNHDQAAFKRWGKKMKVKVSILGPADWDVPGQINTIEEVIGTKPTGLLIN
jgi:ribose transport system substrate-binding protein